MTSAPASKTERSLIGETLRGTYRVLSILDQGGMGLVFEAEHVRLRRRVAVKVLAHHLVSDVQALARFNREAEIISQLEHPNIVQITDFDMTEHGEPYIVMELLKGESLSDRLARDGCLSVEDSARIAHQVASGLFAAHEVAIIHRDLKPANIYLTQMAGQGLLVKLLDFGISKRVGFSRNLTGEFDVLGTPDYMAPEQALGKTASVDERGDQYALAVIAYEMLSGRTPFSGESLLEILQQVASAEAPAIELVAPHVPAAVGSVLKRAMSKEPKQRFPSVLDFAAAFSDACDWSVPPSVSALAIAKTMPAAAPPSSPLSSSHSSPYSAPLQSGQRPAPQDAPPSERPAVDSDSRATVKLGNASTLPGNANLQDIPDSLERARQALGLGDLNLAVSYAESALRVAETFDSTDARHLVDAEEMLIDHIFETRIGSLQQQLSVLGVPSNEDSGVSPEQAFLISRLDGGATVEEVLDLSPLSRRDTLRLLLTMLREGLVTTGDERPSERIKL